MKLDVVRYIISKFTDKAETPEELDARLNFAHGQLFAMRWKELDMDSLRPFKKTMGGETPPMMITTGNQFGYGLLPTDYFMWESASIMYGGEEKDVEFVEDDEWDNRKRNYIETPTFEFPITNMQSDRLRCLPRGIQYLNFSYIRKPEVIRFGYTKAKGFIEYDPATSVELPWDDANAIQIIIMVLQDMGVSATKEQVEKARKQ